MRIGAALLVGAALMHFALYGFFWLFILAWSLGFFGNRPRMGRCGPRARRVQGYYGPPTPRTPGTPSRTDAPSTHDDTWGLPHAGGPDAPPAPDSTSDHHVAFPR